VAVAQKSLYGEAVLTQISDAIRPLVAVPEDERIEIINRVRLLLHSLSPFASEPVDCVIWVKIDVVSANDYNPNSVAPPEMRLLEHSIQEDGYTQPIVAWEREESAYEVVDGFHRHRVGRESKVVRERVRGYLPLAVINAERENRSDRIAATIRHNRARGKHKVEAMSDIVIELKRRNWSDEKIGRELGMDPDEVLRLCQITGLAEVFANQEFSRSWDIDPFGC
jgi:ParB-like chromosome segregation protein Spo0J